MRFVHLVLPVLASLTAWYMLPACLLPSIKLARLPLRRAMSTIPEPSSFQYAPKKEILVWLPPNKPAKDLPLMLFFHGGGLVKGLGDHKQIMQPHRGWQIQLALNQGIALASPEYSLMPEHNAGDILEDVRVLWKWLETKEMFDLSRVGVTGSSAGNFPGDQLCLLQKTPPIKAQGRQWGMAGDLLNNFWAQPHNKTPEYVADLARDNFFVKRLLAGDYLDAFTGRQGFSERLRKVPEDQRADAVPPDLKHLFPQLNLTPEYPPTALVHGTADTIVPVDESIKRAESLRKLGVEIQLDLVQGGEHGLIKSDEDQDVVQQKRERMVQFVIDRVLA